MWMPQHYDHRDAADKPPTQESHPGGGWFDCWYCPVVPYRKAKEIASQYQRSGFETRILFVWG